MKTAADLADRGEKQKETSLDGGGEGLDEYVQASPPKPPPHVAAGPDFETKTMYTVKRGDSLSGIAIRFFGDYRKWKLLYETNQEVIGSNPNLIHPGQQLVIPPA